MRVDDARDTNTSDTRTSDTVPGGLDAGNLESGGDWQTRILQRRSGRICVSVAVAAMSFWIVAPNMPTSAVRDRIDTLWTPAVKAGLVQDWAVFSPNPRSQSVDVRARLEFDDGTIDFWDVPEFDPGIGALRQYRWNKWQERVRLDDHEAYWRPTAAWIAEQGGRDGADPIRVTLIRRWIDHEPLTADGPSVNLGWNEFEFFVWERDT